MIAYIERKTLKNSIRYKGKTYHLKKVYDSLKHADENAVGYEDYYRKILIVEVEGDETPTYHYRYNVMSSDRYGLYVYGRTQFDRDW